MLACSSTYRLKLPRERFSTVTARCLWPGHRLIVVRWCGRQDGLRPGRQWPLPGASVPATLPQLDWCDPGETMSEFFTPDFKALPYWWERTPRPRLPQMPLPVSVDVAVVGSGYTGLCAALELARGGRPVFALDAADVGWGW